MLYVLSTSETKIAGYKFPFSLLFLFVSFIFLGWGGRVYGQRPFLSYKFLIRCYITTELNIMYVTDVSLYNQITKLYNIAVNIHTAISREPSSSR